MCAWLCVPPLLRLAEKKGNSCAQGASDEMLEEMAQQFNIEAPLLKGGSRPYDVSLRHLFKVLDKGVFTPAVRQRVVLAALKEPLHKGGCGFSSALASPLTLSLSRTHTHTHTQVLLIVSSRRVRTHPRTDIKKMLNEKEITRFVPLNNQVPIVVLSLLHFPLHLLF